MTQTPPTIDESNGPTIAVDLRALVGPPSGIGYFTLSMLRALEDIAGWRIVGMAHRDLAPEAKYQLKVPLESHGGPFGVWWQQFRLPRRLSATDINLFWSPNTILPARLPVPGVVTIHDLTVLSHPRMHRRKVRWSIKPFLARTVRTARCIAVDSRATADDLLRRFPDCVDRLHVVYPGIEADFAPADPEHVNATRRRLGCPEGFLLYAGTVEPRKNIDRLISAWMRWRASGGGLPLLIVGPYGWHSKSLMRRILALEGKGLLYRGRVERPELVRLMQAARVFVYPSLYEGFGLPPAEAMACGIPTVTSNRSSLPEIVGNAGLLVDPEDTGELVAALDSIVMNTSLAKELSTAGLARVRRFSWRAAAESMNRIFRDALGYNSERPS